MGDVRASPMAPHNVVSKTRNISTPPTSLLTWCLVGNSVEPAPCQAASALAPDRLPRVRSWHLGNGHPALWGAPGSCPEEGPALYGSIKTALPNSWPLRTQPGCESTMGCITQRTGPPRTGPCRATRMQRRFYGQSQVLAGRGPRVGLRGLGQWEQQLPGPVRPQPVGSS